MSFEIEDGSGKGYRAQVDSDHRLHVNSVTRSQSEQAALLGEAYNLSTGVVELTSGSKSCIAYMKYNGIDPFVIKEIIIIPSDSTGGSGNALIEVRRNPTGGTVVDDAIAFPSIQNRDFSSSNSVNNDADIFKGSELSTLTGGDSFASTTRSNFDTPINLDSANIILRKGNSVGVCITPPTSNTYQTWVVAIIGFVETSTVSGDLKS